MQITSFKNLYFKQNIIDFHTHVGEYQEDEKTYNLMLPALDRFTRDRLPNGDTVETMRVSKLNVFSKGSDEYETNLALYKAIKNNNKYTLILSCNPKIGQVEKLEKFIAKHPHAAKGLKFHPSAQKLSVEDKKNEPYFDLADRYNLPCLFHCDVPTNSEGRLCRDQNGQIIKHPYSDPESIYKVAKNHPNTPFVIAHMGSGWKESHDRTIDILVQAVKNGDANLYSDISWVDIDSNELNGHRTKEHIVKAIKALKGIGDPTWDKGDQSFRLIFGTDAPIARFRKADAIKTYTNFIEDIKFAIRHDPDLAPDAEQIIEDIFYNNAKRLIDGALA